jgi:hypothetical protein
VQGVSGGGAAGTPKIWRIQKFVQSWHPELIKNYTILPADSKINF